MFRDHLHLLTTLLTATTILTATAGCDEAQSDTSSEAEADPRDILEDKTELNPAGFDDCSDDELQTLADQVLCLEAEQAALCEAADVTEDCGQGDLFALGGENQACVFAEDAVSEACLQAVAPTREPPSNGVSASKNCGQSKVLIDVAQGAYFDPPDYSDKYYLDTVETFSNNGTYAHIATYSPDPITERCVVGIRGSDSDAEKIASISTDMVTCGALGGQCSEVFKDAYDDLVDTGLVSTIKDMVEGGECERLYIVGHSRGGAIADLLAAFLYESSPSTYNSSYMYVETYGQPRVFNTALADEYHGKIRKLRWVAAYDPVPALPASSSMKHWGTPYLIYWGFSFSSFSFGYHFEEQSDQDYWYLGAGYNTAHPVGNYDDNLDHCS
ncbi:MAG: lipase family protein [Myxococcales bacterium]|nr:lipase family protein [Myxococcales bacterium]